MAHFAQVGAYPTSSKGDGSSSRTAFDPLSSHKYSQPLVREEAAVATPIAEPAEMGFPNFGYSQTTTPGRSYAPEGDARVASVSTIPSFASAGGAAAGAEQGMGGYNDDYGDGFAPQESDLYGPPPRGELSKAATFLGAAASLALVIGISVWGYKLIMRDVTGVPVVSAVSGPLRVQPADPGGQLADHQGLAVNAVAAHGTAEAPADTLRLAPSAIALTDDDQPTKALTAAEVQNQLAAQANSAVTGVLTDEASADAVSSIEQRSHDIDALVAELTEGAVPLEELRETSAAAPQPAAIAPQVEPSGVQSASVSIEKVPASVLNAPGVRITPRPKERPARFSAAPVQAAPASLKTADIDPASLAVGTRLAQLGAYESAEVARSEWVRISGKFGDFFDGKQRVVQRAESGGRIFYRLRAHGFTDLSDARRFCSALVAGNADCIPVSMR